MPQWPATLLGAGSGSSRTKRQLSKKNPPRTAWQPPVSSKQTFLFPVIEGVALTVVVLNSRRQSGKHAARHSWPSMVVEVVVGRAERNGDVHLQQCLSVRIGLFDHADVHFAESCLLRTE